LFKIQFNLEASFPVQTQYS